MAIRKPPVVISGTGHRPSKLGGYGKLAAEVVQAVAEVSVLHLAMKRDIERGISGMALGWDQALATAFFRAGIPFTAAIPCRDHSSRWPSESRKKYDRILGWASEVVIVSDEPYFDGCMQIRNEWMIDNSTLLLSLWDGSGSGGTFNCLQYGYKRGISVVNTYNLYQSLWLSQKGR